MTVSASPGAGPRDAPMGMKGHDHLGKGRGCPVCGSHDRTHTARLAKLLATSARDIPRQMLATEEPRYTDTVGRCSRSPAGTIFGRTAVSASRNTSLVWKYVP